MTTKAAPEPLPHVARFRAAVLAAPEAAPLPDRAACLRELATWVRDLPGSVSESALGAELVRLFLGSSSTCPWPAYLDALDDVKTCAWSRSTALVVVEILQDEEKVFGPDLAGMLRDERRERAAKRMGVIRRAMTGGSW